MREKIALMTYSAYIYRLMTNKLPRVAARPGMFISVGPSGFTVIALLSMGSAASAAIPSDFLGNGKLMADIAHMIGVVFALWLWGLAGWFVVVSVMAHLIEADSEWRFSLGWWGFVFPNCKSSYY
jgi:tellurite resistance protein TehA-like permease